MADLTVQSSARAANPLTFSAATATTGDKWVNTAKEMVLVKNASGGSINVTIDTPNKQDGDLEVDQRVIAVGAGTTALLGPFEKSVYSNKSDSNKAKVICSSVTSITIAIIKMGA